MLRKTTLRRIKHSLGRYIAIIAIVTLGVGFFSGLKITKDDMLDTCNDYLQDNNFFDYELISTLGFKDKDVSNISKVANVKAAEGAITADVLCIGKDKVDRVSKFISLPSKVNTILLGEGRLPKKASECVADDISYDKSDIGKKIKLSTGNNKDDSKKFKYKEYTIVGICESPMYLNYERGSSTVGNGTLSNFVYIPKDGFDIDCYTEVYVRLNSSDFIYSSKYEDLIDSTEPSMEKACKASATRRYNSIVRKAEKKLNDARKKYEQGLADYEAEKTSTYNKLNNAITKIHNNEAKLNRNEAKLNSEKTKLDKSKSKVLDGIAKIDAELETLETNKQVIPPEQYEQSRAQLLAAKNNLKKNLSKINEGYKKIARGKASIARGRKALATAKSEYYRGKSKADSQFAKAKTKLDKAKDKISKDEKDLKKIKKPKTYVLDRTTNIGYVCFENDSSLIDGIAKVFPVFFFLVAALVCMTTMTRMVDEERTQIGVLKALGYSNKSVMGGYLFYAGSAATIGSLIGFYGGSYLFPKVIWGAYGMMYSFDADINYIFDFKIGALSLAASLLCSMGSTFLSCRNDFKVVPAELIRPKAPKDGKRILLERITPIWKKISFLYKVTLRNIFRYKKRFFMMVLGISGCTALLVTGFGVNDSLKNICEFQFDEIMTYDYSVTFDEAVNNTDRKDFVNDTKKIAKDVYFTSETTVDFIKNKDVKPVKLIVSDGKGIDQFIDLHDKKSHIDFPGLGEVVICNEIADRYDVKVGDTISVRNADHDSMKLKVSGICENFFYYYFYISPETAKDGFGAIPEYKTALIKAVDSSPEGVNESSTKIQKVDNVVATSINNDLRARVNKMMESLDSVILLIITCAGALAFIVLYNLTNINITERIREIATIKVLGFYPNETAAYVFRENFILTGISAVVGLLLGKTFHAFVMNQLKIDMISFDVRVNAISYLWAFLLTFIFAAIVSFFMYFKLNKINMAESLKSIE